VQAAKLASNNSLRTNTTDRSLLFVVPEDGLSVDNADQLLTPRETPQPEVRFTTPIILDHLFNLLNDALDSGYSEAHILWTGTFGNPLLTIVDFRGVFDLEVLFYAHSNSQSMEEQLLRTLLFPATFKQIETVFSFSVLDDFLVDNLECKTTAQQYFSKLQSMTSTMFPDYVAVCLLIPVYLILIDHPRIDIRNSCRHHINGKILRIG
jgi:hypothetical protein